MHTVVIIGGGIGGLSAAVELTSRGIPVTVFEQHAMVGGKVHQTTIDGQFIDSGPTVFTMRSVFDDLFHRAGYRLDELVDLIPIHRIARHFWQQSPSLDLFTDVERSCAAIEQFSSAQEADNYRRFAQRSESLFNALDLSFMRAQRPTPLSMATAAGMRDLLTIASSRPSQSLWRSLCSSFKDPRLRQLFARYSTYCGSSPYLAPATLSLIAHAERAGVWTLGNGMQSLARALQKVMEQNGGTVRLNCGVKKIDIDDGKVRGVVLDTGEYIRATTVLFNGDPNALHHGLLGQPAAKAVPRALDKTLSAITLTTLASVSGKELSFHNVFFGDAYQAEFDAIFNHQTIAEDPTLYVCASDRSTHQKTSPQSAAPERLFCLMNAPAVQLTDSQIAHETDKILRTLQAHGLTINRPASHHVVAAPNQFARRFAGSEGALYGQPTHGAFGSFSRAGARTRIKGLYLAGGGIHPGAGVPMVSLSGQLAAESIVQDRQ